MLYKREFSCLINLNRFSKFCDKLVSTLPDIVLWAASVNQLRRPACLEERLLTVALRSPPVVVRQVSESQEILTGKVLPYKSVNIPPPTDGPPILRLAHHDRPGHIGIFPDECEQCGHAIANTLNYLGVAISGQNAFIFFLNKNFYFIKIF